MIRAMIMVALWLALCAASASASADRHFVSIRIAQTAQYTVPQPVTIQQYRIEFDLPSDVAVYGGIDFESAAQIDTNPSGVGSRSVLYYCSGVCDEPLFWVVDGYRTRVERYYLAGVTVGEYSESQIDFNYYLYVPFVAKGN